MGRQRRTAHEPKGDAVDSTNTVIFERLCDLAVALEGGAPIPLRVRQRLANAFDRAIGKALCISWDGSPDNAYIQRSIFRHGERGVRDFVP